MRLFSLLSALVLTMSSLATAAQTVARPTVSVALDPTNKANMIVSGTATGTGDLMICPLLTALYVDANCVKSTTLKSDGTYSAPIPLKSWKFVTVYQGTGTARVFAIGTVPVPSGKAAAAAQKNDLPILVDQPYCDTSLPYSYKSTSTALTMTLGASHNWLADLNSRIAAADQATAPPTKGSNASNTSITIVDNTAPPFGVPLPSSSPDGGLFDGTLYDDGEPLLTVPLPADTFRAQRLLVRTLVSPNAASIACLYSYLGEQPPHSPTTPPTDANGNPVNPIAKGALYHFSLNDASAPQYYLINIVHWKDAPTPSTVTGTIPFFTVASDDWYLVNYADDSDHLQDITQFKLWHHFTPSLTTGDTLRMLGSKRVAFLGIHLAPTSVVDKSAQPLFGAIAPTEQAWYDNVKLKYTIHADSVQSIQMKDLSSLITVVLESAGAPSSFVTPPTPSTSPSTTPTPTPTPPPPPPAKVGPSNRVDETVVNKSFAKITKSAKPTAAQVAAAQKDAAALTTALASLTTEITTVNADLAKITQPALSMLGLSLPVDLEDYGCGLSSPAPLLTLDTASAHPHPSVLVDAAVLNCLNSFTKAQDLDDSKLKHADEAVQKDLDSLNAMDKALIAQGSLATILSGIYTETDTINAALRDPNMSALGVILHGAQLPVLAQDYGCQIDPPTALLSMDLTSAKPSIKADSTIQTCLRALASVKSGTPDTAKIATATTATQKDLDNLKAVETALGKNAVISLYQGLYGAGVLTGMTSLPTSSIGSPVNITGTWTANFAASTKPKAGAPGTPAPVTVTPAPLAAPAATTPGGTPMAPKPAALAANPTAPPARHSGTTQKPTTTALANTHGPSAPSDLDWLAAVAVDSPGAMMTGAAGVAEPGQTTPPTGTTTATGNQGSTGSMGAPAATGTQDVSANPPCKVAATADNLGQAPCSNSGAPVHDEGRSWFDISVGVGITGYKDVTTTTTAGTTNAVPTTVTRENAYGIADIFLIPEDLIDSPRIGIPHLAIGLPFAGQVFDKPYFAVGETLNFPKLLGTSASTKFPLLNNLLSSLPFKARPVFGWVYNKESHKSPTGTTSTRALVPQWAIEISFGQVTGGLSTLVKSSSSGSTTKTTTTK